MLKNILLRTVFMTTALLVLAVLIAPRSLAVTFNVNSSLDQPDDLSMIGTCHTAANTCTLRAAVMQANRTSAPTTTIMLPAGTYTLTIPKAGVDGEENGDLNLTTPGSGNPVISIVGAGAAYDHHRREPARSRIRYRCRSHGQHIRRYHPQRLSWTRSERRGVAS